MPVGINQPSNQIRLTNVSLVRLKKGKKRFEIACYKNKVLEWRSGTETDLDNVLQIPSVFLSVGKGQTAPAHELAKAFGPKTAVADIVLEILNRGELQVGEKERAAQLERVHAEVVDIVAGKLVDPGSKRVYTAGMIAKALEQVTGVGGDEGKGTAGGGPEDDGSGDAKGKAKELPTWTGVVTTRSAKSQALDAMKVLIARQPIPVARARMRLRVVCPTGLLKTPVKGGPKGKTDAEGETEEKGRGAEEKAKGTVKEQILSFVEQVESQDVVGEEWEVTGFVEPGAFKGLGEFVGAETRGRGRVEVLDMAVVHEGD